MIVDTHCHLGDARFDDDRAAVLSRARAAGVHHIVTIADSLPATELAVSLARRHGLSATAGVHPHEASSWNSEIEARIATALDDPVVVAVGETGLDYHYDYSPRDVQRRAFAAQLALAAERRKPVVVHAREADADMTAILRELGQDAGTVILHSFSSGRDVFDAGLEIGAYVSFSGLVTFKNWALADLVVACPADRLLVETDAPYLAPHPYRGKRNEPAFVTHVAARVAKLRGTTPDETVRQTTRNAVRCFGDRLAAEADR